MPAVQLPDDGSDERISNAERRRQDGSFLRHEPVQAQPNHDGRALERTEKQLGWGRRPGRNLDVSVLGIFPHRALRRFQCV